MKSERADRARSARMRPNSPPVIDFDLAVDCAIAGPLARAMSRRVRAGGHQKGIRGGRRLIWINSKSPKCRFFRAPPRGGGGPSRPSATLRQVNARAGAAEHSFITLTAGVCSVDRLTLSRPTG